MRYLILGLFLVCLGLAACQKEEGVFEKAGKKADEGLEKIHKGLEENGDN